MAVAILFLIVYKMRKFRTNLFNILSSSVIIVIDGFEVVKIDKHLIDSKGNNIYRCYSGVVFNDWYFKDQEVVLDDGGCTAETATGEWDISRESSVVKLSFYVRRNIIPNDLTNPNACVFI